MFMTEQQTRIACIAAVVCCFVIVFLSYSVIFIEDDDDSGGDDLDNRTSQEKLRDDLDRTMSMEADSIQKNQSSNGEWDSPAATALSALALLEYGVDATEVYMNYDGVNVSIASENDSGDSHSASDSILDFESFNDGFDPGDPSSVDSLNYHVQTVHVIAPNSSEEENFTILLVESAETDGNVSSWAGDPAVTARAVEALSLTGGLESSLYDAARSFVDGNGSATDRTILFSAGLRADMEIDNVSLLSALDAMMEIQHMDGGFNLSGGPSDPGDTVRVLHALSASYRYWDGTRARDAMSTLESSVEYLMKTDPPDDGNDYGKALRLYEFTLAMHVIESWYFHETIDGSGSNYLYDSLDFPEYKKEMSDGSPAKEGDDDDRAFAMDSAFGVDLFVPCFISLGLSLVSVYFIALYARIGRKNAFDGIRKDIYEYIRENPGEHFNAIMRHFEISPNAATHHLKVLEYLGYVSSYRHEKYKRFYVKNHPEAMGMPASPGTDHGDKRIISLLKNDTSRRFMEHVISHPDSNQKEIAANLGIHPSTANWHAQRLMEGELLNQERQGKDVFYRIRHEEMVSNILQGMAGET